MILYFSASGNSRFIAEMAGEMLSDKLVCLNDRIKKQDFSEIYSDRPFILVCPVFAWRIPRVVQEHLQHTMLSGNGKIYLLVTTCGSSGNTGGYAKKFFRGIGKEWMGWHTFYMPGSYVAFMENPDLEHAEEMNRAAREHIGRDGFVHQCPERAVEFRKISVGKNRYYNQGK